MASGDEKANKFWVNVKKDIVQLYGKLKQYPLISLLFIIAVLLLIFVPHVQVSLSGINNSTIEAAQENQDRATLAQILGGIAIAIGLYYTWRRIGIAEEDLKATKEGQITDRFTRAVNQLGAVDKDGNPALEIRLGGIYALERIANESDKDYWPIMEIITAYVRKNSPIDDNNLSKHNEVTSDIQTIITVLGRRKHRYKDGEPKALNLSKTCLDGIGLYEDHLEGIYFRGTHFKRAYINKVHLEEADLREAYFTEADLKGTNFERAILFGANLKGAKNLTVDQLCNVKTLYKAELDPELEAELRANSFGHLLDEPER
jgi:hypothetical protein